MPTHWYTTHIRTRLKQGLVCMGACRPQRGHEGELAWPSFPRVLRYTNPPFPPLRRGSLNAEPMIRWGPRDRFPLAVKRQTGGTQSVSRPRGLGAIGWGWPTGARRKKGPEEARLGLDRTTRIIRVAGSRLK